MVLERLSLEDYTIEIIDNPDALDEEEKKSLVSACIPVAREGFKNDDITENDIRIHAIEGTTGVYLKNKQGDIIGFGGSVSEIIQEKTVLHLKGTVLLPEYQGKGLYKIITPLRVLRESEKIGEDFYVGTRTQNPKVFGFMSRKLDLFPKASEQTPEEIRDIAEGYAKLVQEKHSDFIPKEGIIFNRDTSVVKRAYGYVNKDGEEFGLCMYGKNIPQSDYDVINKFIERNLDLNNGDALILLGKFDKERYLKVLESIIPTLDQERRLYMRFSL